MADEKNLKAATGLYPSNSPRQKSAESCHLFWIEDEYGLPKIILLPFLGLGKSILSKSIPTGEKFEGM